MSEPKTVSHAFENLKKCDDEKKADNNKDAVICVGSTGTGKSSLIQLFCGNNVVVGHSVNSATKGSHLYQEINSSTKYWLDSQGANDSDGADDEKVLTDVLKKLYDNQITNIKVVWCISGDFDRAKQEFQTQAKFIMSLGNGVWNSCLIVQKKGPIEPDDIDGVLEAARNKGGNIGYGDHRLFGYTGLDYMSDKDKAKDRLLKKILKKPDTAERRAELLDDGYLDNKQILQHIQERLGHLSSLHITFTVKKCEKCGVKGDPRFIYVPCHTEKEQHHPKSTVLYHPGDLKNFHTGGTYSDHPRGTNSYHSGSLDTTYHTEYYHSSSRTYYNWLKHFDTEWRHACCEKYEGSSGCKSRQVSSTSYSCCGGSSGSSGCRDKYSCCGRPSGSDNGCRTRYRCCDRTTGSNGCREEWSCCSAGKSNAGCKRKYECCDKDLGEDGCEDRCQSCHKAWGTSEGCIQTTKKL